jgi:uncharacterized protein YjgD (DUF1641 family)
MSSLTEIYRGNQDREYQIKLAAVTEVYAEDEERIALLDTAVDLIKKAQEEGNLDANMHSSDILTLAVQLVEDEFADVAEQEKVAEVATEDTETLSKEAAAEVVAMGEAVGQVLAERGITAEDIEKIASDEDAEALGQYCAQIYAELQANSENA